MSNKQTLKSNIDPEALIGGARLLLSGESFVFEYFLLSFWVFIPQMDL